MTEETRNRLAAAWGSFKDWAYRYLGGLFLEEKDGKRVISFGRCMLLAILGWMFWFWSSWHGYSAVTAAELGQVILNHLPKDRDITQADVGYAAQQVIDALPKSTPPLLETAFLTSCAYVFGSKVAGVANKRLNGR